jgi:hypothetical protein
MRDRPWPTALCRAADGATKRLIEGDAANLPAMRAAIGLDPRRGKTVAQTPASAASAGW